MGVSKEGADFGEQERQGYDVEKLRYLPGTAVAHISRYRFILARSSVNTYPPCETVLI
jgi:hypothetical protein